MIIGQTVFGGTYFSPWFPRQGDGAVFAAEVIASSGTLITGLQTKNKEDTDPADATAGTLVGSLQLTSGVGTLSTTLAKELVRFYYRIHSTSSNWVHFRVLPPAWRMNGA